MSGRKPGPKCGMTLFLLPFHVLLAVARLVSVEWAIRTGAKR